MTELSDAEILRYNRQITLRGFDFEGQEHLKGSRVLLVGLGGLGCAAAQYLVAAGVGHLTLLDFDTVSLSNLQRQILHYDADIGEHKVHSAAATLRQLNPYLSLECLSDQQDEASLYQLIAHHDIVLDCTDNVATREQINLGAFHHRKPLVSGAAIRMEGLLAVFTWQPDEPCYHCLSQLFGEQALSCAETGVMSALVGVIGALQAMEALKLLSGFGISPVGKIVMYDAMTCQFREMRLPKQPQCPVCGTLHQTDSTPSLR